MIFNRSSKRGVFKTLLLGFFAFVAICYALLVVLEIPTADVLMLVAVSVGVTVLLALIGFVSMLALHFIKKLF